MKTLELLAKISAEGINIPVVDANKALSTGLNIAYFAAGAVAVIVIIFAGYKYVVSMGDSSEITKARDMILYAVIGLIVIGMAFAITSFVIGKF